MASITNNFSGPSFANEAPLLRSVSLPTSNQGKIINRRCTSNESPSFMIKAVQAQVTNNHNNNKTTQQQQQQRQPQPQEDILQDFTKWAKEQTVRSLPCRTCTPLMLLPTHMTLHHVPLDTITPTLHDCLARLVTQGVYLTHITPHPDHKGRVDIGCIFTTTACGTSQLKFVIQLWRLCTSNEQGNCPDSVVVELIRRRGCPILMHHLRLPLFTALQSLQNKCDAQQPPGATLCNPMTPTKVASVLPKKGAASSTTERPFLFPPPLRIGFSCL